MKFEFMRHFDLKCLIDIALIVSEGPSVFREWNLVFVSVDQLCPNRGPVEGFVRPSLGFRCSISGLHTENMSLFWSS